MPSNLNKPATSNRLPWTCRLLGVGVSLWFADGVITPRLAAQTADLTSGLEAHWTFDEARGSWAGDASGKFRGAGIYDHPNFASSAIQWAEGRFGGAIAFDNTYFLAAPSYFGIGGASPRTISLWVNTSVVPTSTTVLVGWGPNVAQQRWHFKFESSNGATRTENQGGNNFASVPVNDGTWHHVVSVFPEGGAVIGDVRHYVDGVLDDVQSGTTTNPVNTNADPVTGRPVSIGGSPFDAGFRFAEALIDDVRIYSRALTPAEIAALAQGQGIIAGAPPIITLPDEVAGMPFYDPAAGLSFTVEAVAPATVAASGIKLEVNGADVTAQTVITGDAARLTVALAELVRDTDYTVVLTATDSAGLANQRRLSFSTYDPGNIMIEAENFNFGGGQFFESPVLCNVPGGADNCYFDRVSVSGTDADDSLGHSDDTVEWTEVYRYSDGAFDRQEEFDTLASTDLPRAAYEAAGLREYDVDRLNAGDWANYTHTFPTDGAFRLLLRARAGAAQLVELSRVTSDPTQPGQEAVVLGYFRVPAGSRYEFAALTDLAGAKELAVNLTGRQTLRLTAVEAASNLWLNYVMFVPTTKAVVAPTVAISAPSEGQVFPTGGDIVVRAAAEDADGFITRVTFFLASATGPVEIGQASSAPFEITWAQVAAGVYTMTATAADNDGLTTASLPVTVIVDSDPPQVTAVRGNTARDAIEVVFNEPTEAASATQLANYSVSPALGLLSAETGERRVILRTAAQTSGANYTVTIRNVRDQRGNALDVAEASFQAGSSGLFFGLEGYWTFDEGAGAVARDLSGFGRDAAVYQVPAYAGQAIRWVEGRHLGAIDFDGAYFLGVPGYFGIGGGNPRTLSMWIRTDWIVDTGSTALMGWGENATSARWHFKLESSGGGGALRTECQGGNSFGSVPVNDGTWHHIVAVFPDDGQVIGDVNHYVDAVLDEVKNGGIGTLVDTSTDPLLAAPVTLGGAPLGLGGELRPVIGLLDDVRLYSRALDLAEIEALNRGEGILPGGLPATVTITITRNPSGSVTLAWTGGGRLQRTAAVPGGWEEVLGATSPHTVEPTGTAFYRTIQP